MIDCTPEHPLMIEQKGWTQAGRVEQGDCLVSMDGDCRAAIEVLAKRLLHPAQVFTLQVEELHAFYVGEGRILAHNKPHL